ncbi:MAG: ATP-binding protein, partial [Anaerolineae bacterium]|nr:ATP-binding protein [Anaerolineae bacterium]
LKLDEQIINYLLEQQSLDSRLGGFCEWVVPVLEQMPDALKNLLPFRPLHVYFCGLSPTDHLKAAQAAAAELEMTLLTVQSAHVEDVELIFREAWLKDSALYFEHFDAIASVPPLFQKFMEALAEDDGVTMMGGTAGWPPSLSIVTDVVVIPFAPPEFQQRRLYWQTQLSSRGIETTTDDLNALAGRFRLTPHQIEQAAVSATGLAWLRAENLPSPDDLFTAARSQFSHALDGIARKVTPVYTWENLVLPEDVLEQLREMGVRVAQQPRVMDEWGFAKKLSQGKGISALFTGAPGTGKTMAAEVIAHTLKLDLYRIDLSGVVSKYIGETEKNLNRIFDAAENTSAILFFDEADALFGKRSEVRDSHDRYANIEISYLLQKMETYEGITILATNLRQNMDEAFLRRLAFIVHFPFPDAESRRLIWQGIYAPETPLSEDVNFGWLADTFKLCGGSIKNVALASAFLAASNGREVHRVHILHALKREYTKMGEVMPELPA